MKKLQDDLNIINKVANMSHIIWSNWIRYMLPRCSVDKKNNFIIPKDLIERWYKQSCINYKDLTNEEKQSDIEIALKYLKLIDDNKV